MLAKDVKNGQYFTTDGKVYRRIFNRVDLGYLNPDDSRRTSYIICSDSNHEIVRIACKAIVTLVS